MRRFVAGRSRRGDAGNGGLRRPVMGQRLRPGEWRVGAAR
jgi:hypothetical protein